MPVYFCIFDLNILVSFRTILKFNFLNLYFLLRAPGLEPKTSTKEIFLLLKEISTLYLEDIRKGKTGTVKQLLTLLSGVKQ
jgi:hypothetical protein